MSIRLRISVPDPADTLSGYGAGALVRVERAATEAGAYAEITTIPVVAGTVTYEYWDAAGLDSSWYRTRYSNAGATLLSDYSVPFAPAEPTAYASIDYVLQMFETRPSAPKLARLEQLLTVATSELAVELQGRDYFRHPASGTETWYGDVGRDGILHAHDGIVALSTLEISQDQGGSFTTVDVDDYVLRGSDPDSSGPVPAGEPAFHVVLTGTGSIARFPRGINVVRQTGARGWPAVPVVLVEACAQRARQLAYADPSYSGVVPGESEYGAGPVSLRWPQTFYNFLAAERHRFWCHV